LNTADISPKVSVKQCRHLKQEDGIFYWERKKISAHIGREAILAQHGIL
jgi:hypothetical protein